MRLIVLAEDTLMKGGVVTEFVTIFHRAERAQYFRSCRKGAFSDYAVNIRQNIGDSHSPTDDCLVTRMLVVKYRQ